MPLPLTVSCFSKIQIGFTFLVPAHLGSPGQRAVKRVCVCVRGYDLSFGWVLTFWKFKSGLSNRRGKLVRSVVVRFEYGRSNRVCIRRAGNRPFHAVAMGPIFLQGQSPGACAIPHRPKTRSPSGHWSLRPSSHWRRPCGRPRTSWLRAIDTDVCSQSTSGSSQPGERPVTRAFQFGQNKFRFDSIRQSDKKFAASTQIFE